MTKPQDNPLIQDSLAIGLPDFSRIEPENVAPAIEQLLSDYRKGVNQALQNSSQPGWTFVESEVEWSDRLSKAWSPVSHLNSVADNPELRDAYNNGLERLTEHNSWRQQSAEIYQTYKDLMESDLWPGLDNNQQRIVELELRDFELSGVGLPEAKQAEYRELVLELSKLGSRFSENLLDATRGWTRTVKDEAELKGLPEAERNLLAEIARSHEQSGWLIDLNYPAFHAIMTHAENRALREEVYTAYVTRASDQGPCAGRWDNAPLISKTLRLRHRLAELLGFSNYAEYALARRMARSPADVMSFLDDLVRLARPSAEEQFAELQAFAAANGAEDQATENLEAWDVAFWAERMRQQQLNLSDEELKPYFSLPRMLEALEYTAESLFSIRLVADGDVSRWHDDVSFYWIENGQGERFAGLYMDLYARQDKRGGAWMDVCRSRRQTEKGLQLPVAYLTCNFAPPADGRPSLLTHRDVETLFHEFGHCLHHVLTQIDWPQVNGISNVEWDAVELPSQLLENWCWDDQILSRFACHFESGEPIPAELKDRLLRSRTFQGALFLVRQLEYALADFRLHLEYDRDQPRDPLELLIEIREQVAVAPVPSFNRFLNGFAHIFGGGYAAGYYSYLWAEQLAADAWGRFREEGALAREPGDALRDEILSVGGSRPAMESFIAFRGRQPDPRPLLASYGLELPEEREA